MIRRAVSTTSIFIACALCFLVTATAAQAASPRVSSDGWLRNCTDVDNAGCQHAGTWHAGTYVDMVCWIDDSWATGEYSSNRWFYVAAAPKKGFIHSSKVTDQVSVPNCGTHGGVSSSRWAAMHIGQTRPSQAEASGLGINDNMWSGWCAAFVTGAYRYGFDVNPTFLGNARPRYYSYLNAGLMQPWSAADPFVGSLVFWPNVSSPYGHVAIYVGNGQVVSTQGMSDPSKPVARLSVTTWGTPAGWVKPTDVY